MDVTVLVFIILKNLKLFQPLSKTSGEDKGGGKLSKVDVYIPFNQIDKGNNLVSYTVSIHNTLRGRKTVG